ncbi:hypothetical protein L6452_17801 [Arctium lappa]|uniref:Uncharacterized protein n=1 Tax=Arctium lappa TaxID=4217 RepID=A0ACB9C492_ARCLA|nr:hypothetical protein L6452_17801 [Arctium lappa]
MEKLMFQKSLILKKIQLLQNELTLIDVEMEFERKFSSKQQQVTNEPMIEKSRSIASPEQTAYGKDLSNPLTPVALAKSQQEGSSSSSLDSLNLRPNGEMHNPIKPKANTLVHSQECLGTKAYYVVFNGPKEGIYTSWNIAEQAVKGILNQRERFQDKTWNDPKENQHAMKKLLKDMEDYDLEATYRGKRKIFKKLLNRNYKHSSAKFLISVKKTTPYCLMTSFSSSNISEEDYAKIKEFQKQLVSPHVFGNHYPTLCNKIKRDKVFSITYLVAYALTNSHHSVDYRKSEYIEIEDVFSEIGVIEEKQFSSISPLDNSWAIDIAKNKLILEQNPRMSFRNNHLEIEESSNRRYEPSSIRELSQRDLLHSVSRRVDGLSQKLELLG